MLCCVAFELMLGKALQKERKEFVSSSAWGAVTEQQSGRFQRQELVSEFWRLDVGQRASVAVLGCGLLPCLGAHVLSPRRVLTWWRNPGAPWGLYRARPTRGGSSLSTSPRPQPQHHHLWGSGLDVWIFRGAWRHSDRLGLSFQ